jgi:hypothetical protein
MSRAAAEPAATVAGAATERRELVLACPAPYV